MIPFKIKISKIFKNIIVFVTSVIENSKSTTIYFFLILDKYFS